MKPMVRSASGIVFSGCLMQALIKRSVTTKSVRMIFMSYRRRMYFQFRSYFLSARQKTLLIGALTYPCLLHLDDSGLPRRFRARIMDRGLDRDGYHRTVRQVRLLMTLRARRLQRL